MAQGEGERVRIVRWNGAALRDEGAARALCVGVRAAAWREAARALKRDARVIVLAGEAPPGVGLEAGARIVVKTWRRTRATDALRAALGRTQAERHWRGAATLAGAGVRTAATLALCRAGREETLVMREIAGKSLLHHLDEWSRGASALTIGEASGAARAVGAQVRRLADAGWFNRDNKPSNLIVMDRGARAGEERFEIAVIDTVGLRRDRLRVGGLRMLTSLMLEPMGVGRTPGRTMRMRALREASGGASLTARKSAWRAVAQAIDEHGDPTPRVNPLETPG